MNQLERPADAASPTRSPLGGERGKGQRFALQQPLPPGARPEAPLPDPSDWSFELIERYHDVIRAAAKRVGNYRLTGSTLYVTIEPCQMCVGAMIHARIARLVYGAVEPKAGAIESAMRAHEHPALNHRIIVTGGVLEAECRETIQEFFRERR